MNINDRITIGEISGQFIASVSHRLVWDTIVHVTEAKETKLQAKMLAVLWILKTEHLDKETLKALENIAVK